jgi:hypothetical protein
MKSDPFSRKDPRNISARSRSSYLRGTQLPNSPSIVQLVDQRNPETEQKQEEDQEPISLGARLMGCVPDKPETLLFCLVALVYLPCALALFIHSWDGSMLRTLLYCAGAWIGLPTLTSLIPWGKKGDDQLDYLSFAQNRDRVGSA